MAVIGNSSTQQAFTPAIDYFSGNGSTTAFTLSRPVASVAQVQVTIDNVAQNPSSAYTVSSNTITFTSAPLSGTNNIYVYYTSPITDVIAPGQGTVTATSMASSTGTGAGVFQTSPTINTPTLASANITTALTLTGASGTSGQALTSGGSGVAPTWTTIGASAATPTALGTVYGSTLSSGTTTTTVGYQALTSNTGNENTALGFRALYQNTSGTENVAIGTYALQANTTGYDSVAVGRYALYASNGVQNTALGANTMYSNTSGINNTCLGQSAGYSNTTGASNTAVGQGSFDHNTTGSNSTAVGFRAGTGATTGDQNIFIGYYAGSGITTGGNNIYIGGGQSSASASNECVVGQGGTTGKGNNTGYFAYAAYNSPNSTNWSTTSDRRLKKNIVDHTDGLDKIVQIKIRNFEYRLPEEITELDPTNAIKIKGVQLGVIAQELHEVLPDCVKEESTGVMSVQADNITWHLVNAIKDLKALNDTQAATITALTARITALENR